ncbi:hypothetical protein [Paucibacter sp. Y2R2-4]|uniref:hypothetical protein n=1 Tax=Paucibacter sp. Y2R2-4 TaxID=2893553 RepID=UPI0021E3E935|nr:hypothetical protein [Paucibacter sp. Y2R2-4]MCV2350248.1 hypothetical protein [Paucibacter sp. Y2R2-4]
MNCPELARRLEEEGCKPSSYAIGNSGGASDAYCLVLQAKQWQVFYTERGRQGPPIFSSEREDEACEFFLQHLLSLQHDHCVGLFRSQQRAEALSTQLQELGLSPWQDQIPFGGPQSPRYRVFVSGKAIFVAQSHFPELPLKDE